MEFFNEYDKENVNPKARIRMEDYEKLQNKVISLQAELKENNNLNTKVKTELLQVSKKETEEYADHLEEYANEYKSLNHENESLKHEINAHKEQLQTLAVGIEQQSEKNKHKSQEIQNLQHKNMSLQHEKVLLQQQLHSLRDNFFNDDSLMRVLCSKLAINSSHYPPNLNGLINFVSDAKRCNTEYIQIKQQLADTSEESERYKIEVISYKKQVEIFEENKNFEKGQFIHFESLRAENENLRNEIRILEESNSKLGNDVIARSEKKMSEMTDSLNKMQLQHNKIYTDYEKKLEKIKREKKAYQHKCEHFKKETKGFATKYEELTKKHIELEQQLLFSSANDKNVSEDYERRMTELESNNDALNEQLQQCRQEIATYKNTISQLKAAKTLMETMWNEFKQNQSQQSELLVNNLQNTIIDKMQHSQQQSQSAAVRDNDIILAHKQEIYQLKQQLDDNKLNQQQNQQISMLQQQNQRLQQEIFALKQHLKPDEMAEDGEEEAALKNNTELKQRLGALEEENEELHKRFIEINRNIENKQWETQLNESNLQNDIQILQTKLCHNSSRLQDKILEIEELKKLFNGAEIKLEEIRNKYESVMQLNAKYESENSNLQSYNGSLKTSITQQNHEIKNLRSTLQNHKFEDPSNSHSELIETLKYQNNELNDKLQLSQENIFSLRQEMSQLKQRGDAVSDRYNSNIKNINSHKAQIESLRVSISETQTRENKLIKELHAMKLQAQKYKIEAQQAQKQSIDLKQLNNKLSQQIAYISNSNNAQNNKQYQQFTQLTNKLEVACKNAERLKLTNSDMHSQIEYLKKAYQELHTELDRKETQFSGMTQQYDNLVVNVKSKGNMDNKYELLREEYNKQQDKLTVISKKYEILKQHWEGLNQDRSNAIQQLKSETKRVNELNQQRSKLEQENARTKHELNKKEIELENVDEEKLKWKARTDSLTQAQRKVNDAVIMNEVKIQEEFRSLKIENCNLKQEAEKQMYDLEDFQNKNTQITQELTEWKIKYDDLNNKYEFESGQHDNTLKKLNDIRAVWDGETNLSQLLQMKQQNIQELTSKLTELQSDNDKMRKVMEEQTNVHSSLKTRINVQRNIITEHQQQHTHNENGNVINISMDEYQHFQQQLNMLTELQNKYELAQQEIIALQHELSKWQDIKQDLNTSEIIPMDLNTANNETIHVQMEQLVAYLHKKEQSLYDLQDEYQSIQAENNALVNNIQKLEQIKITSSNSVRNMENKLKMNEQSLLEQQTMTQEMEGQRDALAKRLRALNADNAKLKVELYSLSAAAELVHEQLKTSAVALSSTTEKKQKAMQELKNYKQENCNLQNYNNKLLNEFNMLKFTHQSLKEAHQANNVNIYDDQLYQHVNDKEFEALTEKYNASKAELIEMDKKLKLASQQLENVSMKRKGEDPSDHTLKNNFYELRRSVEQMENNRHAMQIEKTELNKQINALQTKYCALFNEHNSLIQQYQAAKHKLSEMKLEQSGVFIERDLLDYKVVQLKGDKSNTAKQLNNLRAAYFEQSSKFKTEHTELYKKYQQISGERERFKIEMEQLLNEKQTLQQILTQYQTQTDNNNADLQPKLDQLLIKNAQISSKLTLAVSENKELNEKLNTAQLHIDELNIAGDETKNDDKYSKDMIANIKDKLVEKTDEYQQLQINYQQQENKAVKSKHDLQTLLSSFNNLSAENEQLHSENQALYQQLQIEQINKLVQVQSSTVESSVGVEQEAADKDTKVSINLQSLVKRGKLLTEQCADLHVANNKLESNNGQLTQKICDLEQQISLLNISNDSNDTVDPTKAKQECKAVVLIDSDHHDSVLRELRHRNEQLLKQMRSLQQDLETDTELIDRLQKENSEIRAKLKTTLQRRHSPQKIVAVDSKGEPWQDIIKGLRKQLQEARSDIAELCEESMGKTQHINDVESANSQLVQNLNSLEKQHKELTASLAATPAPEEEEAVPDAINDGQLAQEYARNEELCDHMQTMINRIMTEQKTKQELTDKFDELQNNLTATKTQLIEIGESKNNLCKRNGIIEHELSLLKRAKGQLSDHNEELAKEITNLQSIQFEQQQKISTQQQEMNELQTLYQNVQSQLEIKETLNQQFQNERQEIIQLFALTEIMIQSEECAVDKDLESEQRESDKFEALDIKHEIECLLNNYQKLMQKTEELQRTIDRNEKQYLMESDFNDKFEEIKRLLTEQHQHDFLSETNDNDEDDNGTNNGSANYRKSSIATNRLSLSANLSPYRHSTGGVVDLNMTNPDLLNTSIQHIQEIQSAHKLMREEEFEQLLNTKKELSQQLQNIQSKYDILSSEYAAQSQKVSLMEQEYKHISNQLENVCSERDSLRLEMNKNKELTDTFMADFKSIGAERDNLYEKTKLLQQQIEIKSDQNDECDRLKQEINELNDLNMKQANQIELLQNNNQKCSEFKNKYNSMTVDFKSMKKKYEKLNQEYDNLSSQQQKLYYEMNEIKQMNQQKSVQIDELREIINKNKLKSEADLSDYQNKITELQLLLDSTKFEMVAQQSSDSNKHIEDLNEQLLLLRKKYENRLQQNKKQYNDKISKMNEAVTKLSGARSKLQNELIDAEEREEKDNVQMEYLKDELNKLQFEFDENTKKMRELRALQALDTNNNNIIAKEQHEMLIKQNDDLHQQLKESREEHQQLRQKAQLHYLRRKEEWKKLKQLENKQLQCKNENEKERHEYKGKAISFKKEIEDKNIEFAELLDKFKLIEQQNNSLSAQILRLRTEIQEMEEENNNLREERRRSIEGKSNQINNEYLAEKINLQRQIRVIREERDIAEKKYNENESKHKQLSLKIHQLQLQFESLQERYQNVENEKIKLKQQMQGNDELVSTLQAEKTSLSQKNNELYDGNVNLEEENRKSQQEIGKFQVKSDRLRQQRDYAKSKYKELKAKFNSLENQFRNLQSRYNKNNSKQNNSDYQQTTSQTLPFS